VAVPPSTPPVTPWSGSQRSAAKSAQQLALRVDGRPRRASRPVGAPVVASDACQANLDSSSPSGRCAATRCGRPAMARRLARRAGAGGRGGTGREARVVGRPGATVRRASGATPPEPLPPTWPPPSCHGPARLAPGRRPHRCQILGTAGRVKVERHTCRTTLTRTAGPSWTMAAGRVMPHRNPPDDQHHRGRREPLPDGPPAAGRGVQVDFAHSLYRHLAA